MKTQHLELIKESEKSKVYLTYDSARRCMVIEKHLRGKLSVYQTLKHILHPNLPKIFDVIVTDEETIVIEEYVSGGSIAQIKTSEKQLTRWFFELCDVLSVLHKRGILHRDIKPSNLLIGQDGHLRLIDFDAARETKTEADCDTRLLGTRGYAPPEQYGFAQTDERTDLYALGVTFRELLGDTAKKARWRHLLKKCTTFEPKYRYRSVKQMKNAVLWERFLCRVILPVFLSFCLLFSAFSVWTYADADARNAIDTILSSRRDLIFNSVDMDAVKRSSLELQEFLGDETEIYRRVLAKAPKRAYIATGYCTEGGYLLLGGFSATYKVTTGELVYHSFDGLYYMADGEIHEIPPRECARYAPAVLKLYNLELFE